MAEDEDLLDAIKEWEGRCKEAERQGEALLKAVDWMSQKIKAVEAEHDAALLQIEALTDLLHRVSDTWGRSWDCSSNPGHAGMHNVIGEVEECFTLKQDIVGHCQHHESHDGKCVWCGVAIKQKEESK